MAENASESAEEIIDHIVLEVKMLAGLEGWGEATTGRLRERLLASHDEDIKRFLSSLEGYRPARPWGQTFMGVGELVLGALLTVGGLLLIVPTILGFSSRGEIARYLSDLALGLSAPGISDPLVVGLGFAFALFLILAALYTLRQAARSLKDSGLVPPSA